MIVKRVLVWPLQMMGAVRQVGSDAWKPRKCVVNMRMNRDAIRIFAQKDKLELDQILHAVYLFEMPAGWSAKKKAEMNGTLHTSKPDTDNLTKNLKDALLKQDQRVAIELGIKLWSYASATIIFDYAPIVDLRCGLDICLQRTGPNDFFVPGTDDSNTVAPHRVVAAVLLQHQESFKVRPPQRSGSKTVTPGRNNRPASNYSSRIR